MMRWRQFRIHPLLIIMLFGIVMYGDIALYAMLLTSLLVHEAGHLLAALVCRVNIKSIVLLPYGAEITFATGEQILPKHLLIIALAGPVATAGFAIICSFLPELYRETLLHIQFYLFFFNMLPIWSLDGGRIVYAFMLLWYPSKKLYEYYVTISFFVVSILVVVTMFSIVRYLPLFVFSSFLWIQVWKEWKYRKYRGAFEKHVLHRLT